MLNWANRFSISVFLDNNEYRHNKYHFYECLVAADPYRVIHSEENQSSDPLNKIYEWHEEHKDWLFGNIGYEYRKHIFKNKKTSQKAGKFNFPPLFFFCPKTVCYISADKKTLTIETIDSSARAVFRGIVEENVPAVYDVPTLSFQKRLDKAAYLQTIASLKEHIRNGDCYEINFCNEGYAENISIHPLSVFHLLNQSAPAPFAAFYKHNDQYMMCSSPERYLCKSENKLISQPIKGTAKRSMDKEEDDRLKQLLYDSKKDRAENVMIVDLTRNDLSVCCATGSIEVEELYGIYSYPRVHQMVSTVSGIMKKDVLFTDAIKCSFPMGSMTGAPKVKVMELIDRYEPTMRELFSGSIGYISPKADFDFNVIIRSLFYNARTGYLSYQTGGAITYDSVAEQEWEEAGLKAQNMECLFKG